MPKKPKGVIKDHAYFSMIGRKGGLATKRIKLADNPNYYSDIGLIGGEKMKERGREFYSMIGKMPSKTNRPRGGVKHVAI